MSNGRNWKAYNQHLKNKGNINFYFTEDLLNGGWYSDGTENKGAGVTGPKYKYSNKLIMMAAILKVNFRLAYRQLQGMMESVLSKLEAQDLSVPDYSTMCRRFERLGDLLQEALSKVRKVTGDVHVLVDATGLKVFESHEWNKHKEARKPWVKLHVAVDAKTQQAISYKVTDRDYHDGEVLEELLDDAKKNQTDTAKIVTLSADGAYTWNSHYDYLEKNNVKALMPLPKNAVLSGDSNGEPSFQLTARDKALIEQTEAGGTRAWKKSSNYHQRSKVETFFSRFKAHFGEFIFSRKSEKRSIEIGIKVLTLNRFAYQRLDDIEEFA